MALWVLHEKCYGSYRDRRIKATYEADSFMLQLRASNLVGPIAKLALPRLAQALEKESMALASLVACYSFELEVRAFAGRHGLLNTEKLKVLIERLFVDGQITPEKKEHWLRLKRVRDVFFHDGKAPTVRDAAILSRRSSDWTKRCGPTTRTKSYALSPNSQSSHLTPVTFSITGLEPVSEFLDLFPQAEQNF
jgi:hypothetical protein